MAEYISLRLVGAGKTIELDGTGAGSFAHVIGSTGFGMTPTVTRYSEGSGTGSVFLNKRLGARALVVKIAIMGATRQGLEDNWNALAVVFRDNSSVLQVVYPDGSVFGLPVNYESGLEGSFAKGDLRRFSAGWVATADVALTAPDPYWRRVEASTISLEAQGDVPAFLAALARLRLGVSQSIADTVITNPGTVPAQVCWQFQGPASAGTEVSINGQGFQITRALSVSDVVVVDASKPGVPAVTLNGTRDYSVLAKAPKFPPLQAGNNLVHLSMPGSVPPTWVVTDGVEAINEATNPVFAHGLDGLDSDGAFSWAKTAAGGSAAFSAGADIAAAVWYEFTAWKQPWISTAWQASGDQPHLFIQQLDADGQMIRVDYADNLALSGVPIDSACVKIRVGVGWYGQVGAVTSAIVVFQQPGYSLFTGDSGLGYAWETVAKFTGEAHKSTSQLIVGGVLNDTNLVFDPTVELTDYKSAYFGGDASGAGSTLTGSGLPEHVSTFFRMTQNGNASPSGTTPEVFQLSEAAIDSAVSPGWVRTAGVWVRASVACSLQLGIAWEKSTGDGIYPYSSGAAVTAPAGQWVKLTASGTAPADAAKFRLIVSKTDGAVSPANTTYDITAVQASESLILPAFFAPGVQPLSRSIKHVLTKHGGSLIQGSFHPGKEVVV